MASRMFGTSAAQAGLVFIGLGLGAAALAAETPRYTYVAINYESTETKEGVDPSNDIEFNNGDFSLATLQGSLGLTDWSHLHGEYFTGDCNSCEGAPDEPGGTNNRDFDGYKIGAGINPSLGFIGLEQADLIVRAHYLYIDMEGIDDENGYTVDTLLRAQISERAEIWAGTEYQNIDEIKNIDIVIGAAYELWNGVTLTGSGIIFNNESGFDIGLRWYFGDQLLGRDAIF
jgi:hypothetical protein